MTTMLATDSVTSNGVVDEKSEVFTSILGKFKGVLEGRIKLQDVDVRADIELHSVGCASEFPTPVVEVQKV